MGSIFIIHNFCLSTHYTKWKNDIIRYNNQVVIIQNSESTNWNLEYLTILSITYGIRKASNFIYKKVLKKLVLIQLIAESNKNDLKKLKIGVVHPEFLLFKWNTKKKP